jgi:hypothetical protein
MRSFLQHLKAAWRYGTIYPYLPWADETDSWTVVHGAALSQFMNSPAGQVLKARMTNLVSRRAIAVATDPKSTLRDNGTVEGLAGLIAFVEGHLVENLAEQAEELTDLQPATE